MASPSSLASKANTMNRQLHLDVGNSVSPLVSPGISARIQGLSVSSPMNILQRPSSSRSPASVDSIDDDDMGGETSPDPQTGPGQFMSFSGPPSECSSPTSSAPNSPRNNQKHIKAQEVGEAKTPSRAGSGNQQYSGYVSAPTSTTNREKPRKRVKTACTNCKMAKTKCDKMRPCARCKKRGQEDCCVDTIHKRRGRKFDNLPTQGRSHSHSHSRAHSHSPNKQGESATPFRQVPEELTQHLASSYHKQQSGKTPRSKVIDDITPLPHSDSWQNPKSPRKRPTPKSSPRGERPAAVKAIESPKRATLAIPAKVRSNPASPSSASRATLAATLEQKSLMNPSVSHSPLSTANPGLGFLMAPPPLVSIETFNEMLISRLNQQLQRWSDKIRSTEQAMEASRWLSSSLCTYLQNVVSTMAENPRDRETLYQRQQVYLSQRLAALGFDSDKSSHERMHAPVAMHAVEPLPFLGSNKVWLNPAARQALGYQEHEMAELNQSKMAFFRLFDISNLEEATRSFMDAISTGSDRYTIQSKWIHKNGDKIDFSEVVTIRYESRVPIYVSSFLQPKRSVFGSNFIKQQDYVSMMSNAQDMDGLGRYDDDQKLLFKQEHDQPDLSKPAGPPFQPLLPSTSAENFLLPMSTSGENLANMHSSGHFESSLAPLGQDLSWNIHAGDSNSFVELDMSGSKSHECDAMVSSVENKDATVYHFKQYDQQTYSSTAPPCSLSAMQGQTSDSDVSFSAAGGPKEPRVSPKSSFVTSLLS